MIDYVIRMTENAIKTTACRQARSAHSQPQSTAGSEQLYDAFISYSHAADGRLAPRLQTALERYAVPWYRRPILHIFRDETNLSATPHAWPTIELNLDRARFLILMASPEAAASKWVRKEVEHWLTTKSAETLLIVLTAGSIVWDDARDDFDWARTTALPNVLEAKFQDEPLHVDLAPNELSLRNDHFADQVLRLAAPLHGKPMDKLSVQAVREVTRRIWHARIAVGIIAALGIAASMAATGFWKQWNEAQRQRDNARTQLLAMQARRADTKATSPNEIERAGALALESIQLAESLNRPIEADAVEAARSALVRLPLVLISHGDAVRSMIVLADGRLASGGADGKIKLWPKHGVGEPVVLSHGSRPVYSLVALKDGDLASGDADGKITLWPQDGRGEPVVLSHGSGPVLSLAVLADGRLASAGGDEIKLWPKDFDGEPIVLSHGSQVQSLAVLKDGRLVSGGGDGKIKIWSKEASGKPVILSHSNGDRVTSLAVLPDGRLVSAAHSGEIKIWPKDDTRQPVTLSHGNQLGSLAVLADGRLASAGGDGEIKIWPEKSTEKPVIQKPEVLLHGGFVGPLALLTDGRLASAGEDGRIKLWPKEGINEPVVLLQESPVLSLTELAGGRLASAGGDGKIKLWTPDRTNDPAVLSHDPPSVLWRC